MNKNREVLDKNMELIIDRFGIEGYPRGQLIPLKQVAVFLGVDVRTLKGDRNFPKKKVGRFYFCPAVSLANWMSG